MIPFKLFPSLLLLLTEPPHKKQRKSPGQEIIGYYTRHWTIVKRDANELKNKQLMRYLLKCNYWMMNSGTNKLI